MAVVVLLALCAVAFMGLAVLWKIVDHHYGIGHDEVDEVAAAKVIKLASSLTALRKGVIEIEERLTIEVGTITSKKTLAKIKKNISNDVYLQLKAVTK